MIVLSASSGGPVKQGAGAADADDETRGDVIGRPARPRATSASACGRRGCWEMETQSDLGLSALLAPLSLPAGGLGGNKAKRALLLLG